MSTIKTTHSNTDEYVNPQTGITTFRLEQHMKAINYRAESGLLKPIDCNWKASGDANRPHAVTDAPFLCSIDAEGHRRIHPTRELDVYFEFGAPFYKPASTWVKVPFGSITRTANMIQATATNGKAWLRIYHAGHYVKLEIELAKGYSIPGGKLAFPVGLQGMTRSGDLLLKNGVPVMHLRKPVAYDAAHPEVTAQIGYNFQSVSGQAYMIMTLPDMSAWERPVIDPTLSLQPDATDGIDAEFTAAFGQNVNNSGVSVKLMVGRSGPTAVWRGLLKFNHGLPPGHVITSSNMKLTIKSNTSFSGSVGLYRLKRAWLEGTRNNASDSPATGCTWDRYDLTNNWETAGGFGANDCEQVAIITLLYPGVTIGDIKTYTFSGAAWADNDLGNGWLLINGAEGTGGSVYEHYSSDDTTPSKRPLLTVEYTLPVTGGRARRKRIGLLI